MDSQMYTESTIISHNIYEVGALNRRRTDRQTTPIPPPNKKGRQAESTKHRRQLNNRKKTGLGNSDDNDDSGEDDDQDPGNSGVLGKGSGHSKQVDDFVNFNHYTTDPIKDSAFERYGDINDHTTPGKYDMRTYNKETIAAINVSQVTPQASKLPSSDRKEHPVDIQPETPLCLDDDSSPFLDDKGEASKTYGIESLSKDSTSVSKDSTSLSRVPRHFVCPGLRSLLYQSRCNK